MLRTQCLATAAATAALAASAAAQTIYVTEIVYVNTPGHPTNVVPGTGGLAFNAGGGSTAAFERPFFSGNGQHFAIHVIAETATTSDEILLLDGVNVLQEGMPAPWLPSENVGLIDAEFGLNDNGDLLIGNNTSAATTIDDVIVLYSGGTWTELAREGGLVSSFVPGLTGDAGNTATWDDSMDTVRLSNTAPLWRAIGLDALTTGTTNDAIFVLGPGSAIQKGVTVPIGLAGGATDPWQNFAAESAYVSPDGALVIMEGDTTGATTSDEIVTVNNVVVVQEGVALPGFANGVDSLGIVKVWVDHANNWYVRGNNDATEDDWVLRNGVVVADSTGTNEIHPGAGEHWTDDASVGFADCFFAFDGNVLGHYVIGGVTDNPDVTRNGVIVLYDGVGGGHVVAREGDPVDMNGNGVYDDDRFFNTFGNDDVLLADDGSVLLVATLRNGAGTAVDQGLFRMRVSPSGSCTFRNGSGINPVAVTCTTLPIVGTTWQIGVSFGPQTLATFLFADPRPIPAFPLFGGELLIAPTAFEIPPTINLPLGYQGLAFSLQAIRVDFDGVDILLVLTNAQDAVIGT